MFSFFSWWSRPALDPRSHGDVQRIADHIRTSLALTDAPSIGLVCGSGFADIVDLLEDTKTFPFADISGFPVASVKGHKANFVFGHFESISVVVQQGRLHPYEHEMDTALCAFPIRLMVALGIKTLILTNASGAINRDLRRGDFVLLRDHIFLPGLAGLGPLVGHHDPAFGERFVPMANAYTPALRKSLLEWARREGLPVKEGVYVMNGGPAYETMAEIEALRVAGADVFGMSTCHEAVVGRQARLPIIGVSMVTNDLAHEGDERAELSHADVLRAAQEAAKNARLLLAQGIRLAHSSLSHAS